MKTIGIYICNYNGIDFLIKCIESLHRQTVQDFDVYVIDNASTDGSPQKINELFGDRIKVYSNSENIGGAGGFNQALEYGLSDNYEFIGLLDNDIVLADDAVECLLDSMIQHPELGIVGAKVMIMDKPEFIQDFCNHISFEEYREICGHVGERDNGQLEELEFCDYVPTCAVLIRPEALKVAGTMPADNFIYYDDIEMSYRMGLFGYEVGAYGKAKVWHKGCFRKKTVNTFSKYYFLRNRLNFFMKYLPEEKNEEFVDYILEQLFPSIIGCYYKNLNNTLKTTMYAFDDAIHLIRGKAEDYKILPIDEICLLEECVRDKKNIIIKLDENDDLISLFTVLYEMRLRNPKCMLHISLQDSPYTKQVICEKLRELEKNFEEHENSICIEEIQLDFSEKFDIENYDLAFQLCSHVKNIKQNILPVVYIDGWCNVIRNEQDYNLFTNYENYQEFFRMLFRPIMLEAISEMKNRK